MPLSKLVDKLYAVEIDSDLSCLLKEKLQSCQNVTLINTDILKIDLKKLLSLGARGERESNKIKVIGNIPYYISTPIIEYLILYRQHISKAYLTVQKEFARRIIATPGTRDYGSLSCFVQYYTLPKVIFDIKNGSFLPSPKVDSSFISLSIRQRLPLSASQEKLFFGILRGAFGKRRKTLRNSLQGIIPQSILSSFLERNNLPQDIRPERLALADFLNLAKFLKKTQKKVDKT